MSSSVKTDWNCLFSASTLDLLSSMKHPSTSKVAYTTTFVFLRFNVSPEFLCNSSSCLLFLCDVISDVKDICYVLFVFPFDRLFDGLPCSFKFCPVFWFARCFSFVILSLFGSH